MFTLHSLKKSFRKRLLAKKPFKNLIYETILKLPDKYIIYLIKNCWFLSSTDDSWAYVFKGNDIPNKYLIFLSDELFNQSKEDIQYTLLHEIGHVILDHKNSIKTKQSKKDIKIQEHAADQFAETYLY